MSQRDISEIRDTVVRRIEFLDSLEKEPKDKRTLATESDCSRTTIDRAIRELEAMELVAYRDGRHHLTQLGQLVAEEYREFEDCLRRLIRLKPFIQWLPLDDFPVDLECLEDAEIFVSDPSNPYAAANRHADVMASAETFSALLPAVGLNQIEAARQSVIDGTQEQHVIIERAVADTLQSEPHYKEILDDLLDSGRVEIAVYDGDIPYFLGLYDDVVHIGVEDAEGIPRALVETADSRVRDWAQSTYEDYRRRSQKLAQRP